MRRSLLLVPLLLLVACAHGDGIAVSSVGGTGFSLHRSFEVLPAGGEDAALRKDVETALTAKGLTAAADGTSAYLIQIAFDHLAGGIEARPGVVRLTSPDRNDGAARRAAAVYRFEIRFIDRVSGQEIYRASAEEAGAGSAESAAPRLVKAALRELPFL